MNKENTLSMNPSFLVSGGVFLFIFALVHFYLPVSLLTKSHGNGWHSVPILFLGYS